MQTKNTTFRVIIVGGSIAGLTLAHTLDKAGVEYILIERRKEIASQEGASIGIMPNGLRILDQLGLYNDIQKRIEPMSTTHFYSAGGIYFKSSITDIIHKQRFGYPIAFLDRQTLLEILYAPLSRRSNILVNKSLTRIHYRQGSKICVYTEDGSSYEGDFVVGADGIHSQVRKEMWRIANSLQYQKIPEKEMKSMKAKYLCIFGISSPISGMKAGGQIFRAGEQIVHIDDGWVVILCSGKGGRLFWYIFRKLDREYTYETSPRFFNKDAVAKCHQIAHQYVGDNIQFRIIWARREVFSISTVEENVYQTWHWGRIVCIGDSIHKINPIIAQGANCAIEDAAILANFLNRAVKQMGSQLSDYDIERTLYEFRRVSFSRVANTCTTARYVADFCTADGPVMRLLWRHFVSYAVELLVSCFGRSIAQGAVIDFLPLPEHMEVGSSNIDSRARRLWLAAALGFVIVVLVCSLLNSELGLRSK